MKLDRDLIFGIVACVLLFMFWNPIMRFFGVDDSPSIAPVVAIATSDIAPEITSDAKLTVKTMAGNSTTPTKDIAPNALPLATLSNPQLLLVFNPNNGTLDSITFEQYKQASNNFRNHRSDISVSLGDQKALQTILPGFSKTKTPVVSHKENLLSVTSNLTNQAGQSVRLTQEWELQNNYIIDYNIKITNLSAAPISPGIIEIGLGTMSSWGRISGDKMRTDSLDIGYYTNLGKFSTIDADDDNEDFVRVSEVKFAALSNKYFSLVLKGDRIFSLNPSHQLITKDQFTISGNAIFAIPEIIDQGQTATLKLGFYAGPKEAGQLEAFAPEAGDLVQLSWGPLNYLAKLLLWLMDTFHRWGCSYGWSIILLTLLVRTVFFPVTMKANDSMRKMQQLQPKIKALREKHKDNPQLQNMKMMELYKTEKINPLGGCLPILLQIPVFFALYSTLDNALQLRHVAFWWSNNLAAPDTVASWALPFNLFGISHFNINPLVIAMTILMVIQQQLTPSTMDPMQKRMMQAMPIVMLFLLYELPSGLTLYWTVSNLFSIFQMLWQNRLNRQHEQQSTTKAPGKTAVKN